MPDVTSTSVTTSVLKCPIILENGKKLTINVNNPKENITQAELENSSGEKGFVGTLINEQMINSGGYQALEADHAYYYTTSTITID